MVVSIFDYLSVGMIAVAAAGFRNRRWGQAFRSTIPCAWWCSTSLTLAMLAIVPWDQVGRPGKPVRHGDAGRSACPAPPRLMNWWCNCTLSAMNK